MLYLLEESSGTVALIEASSEAWKERARFKLEPQTTQRKPDGRIWTHPVVADGKLYLRDQEMLSCFDIRDPKAPAPSTAAAVKFKDPEEATQAPLKMFQALGVAGSTFN